MRSTRLNELALKFWTLSANSLLLPTKGQDMIGRVDGGDEQPDLADGARQPGGGDLVADLERTERQEKEPGGEVAEQPGPRRADGDTGRGQQRRERRRLDAEHAEHGDEHQQLQDDVRAGIEVAAERDVELPIRMVRDSPARSRRIAQCPTSQIDTAPRDAPAYRDEVEAREAFQLSGEIGRHPLRAQHRQCQASSRQGRAISHPASSPGVEITGARTFIHGRGSHPSPVSRTRRGRRIAISGRGVDVRGGEIAVDRCLSRYVAGLLLMIFAASCGVVGPSCVRMRPAPC